MVWQQAAIGKPRAGMRRTFPFEAGSDARLTYLIQVSNNNEIVQEVPEERKETAGGEAGLLIAPLIFVTMIPRHFVRTRKACTGGYCCYYCVCVCV